MNAFSDANNKFEFSAGRFHYRVGREGGRNKNHCGIRAGSVGGFLNGIEDRPALMRRSAFAWSYAAHNLRAIRSASFRVESALASRQPLHNQSSSLIDQNC